MTDSSPRVTPTGTPHDPLPPGRLLRLLLVEQQQAMAELFSAQLSRAGVAHELLRARGAAELERALAAGDVDLVLLDLSTPSAEALSLIDQARAVRVDLPVVVVAGETQAVECLRRGASDYVSKEHLDLLPPTLLRALREADERALRRRVEESLAMLTDASEILISFLDQQQTIAALAQLLVPRFARWFALALVGGDDDTRAVTFHVVGPDEPVVITAPSVPASATHAVLEATHSELFVRTPPERLHALTAIDARVRALAPDGSPSSLWVPMTARGRTLGLMVFASAPGRSRFDRDDLMAAEVLARRLALALDNVRLLRAAEAARAEAESVNRSKDTFLAVLSHELRTPLTAMLGWIDLLRGDRLDADGRRRGIEVIRRNTKLQAQLVDDLLDVSRIVTGKLQIHIRPVDLPAVIDAAVDAVRPAAEAKGIHLVLDVRQAPGPLVADPDRLQQVLWNLLSNAVKFTPGGGHVRLACAREDGHLRLMVADDGKGIAAEFLPHVFERFRQASPAVGGGGGSGGLGLGLAIVRHLIELHGGTVHAASEGEGRGACFTILLPVREEAAAVVVRDSPPKGIARGLLMGVRVLLVEDGEDIRDLLTVLLDEEGALTRAVGTAADALAILDEWRPDVLVSDIGLPGIDGYELMRRIRARGDNLPAVALTGFAGDEASREAMTAGFAAHVAKPVEPDVLVAKIARLCRAATPR